MQDQIRILHRDDVLLLAAYGDLFIQCWSGNGAAHHVRTMFDAHTRFIEQQGHKSTVALSHVTSATVKPPDEAARKVISEHSRLLSNVRAVATVIDADGFGAAVIRSIVSGLLLLSKRDVAHQVFSRPRDGMAFVLRHRDPAHPPIVLEDLASAYESLLQRVGAR